MVKIFLLCIFLLQNCLASKLERKDQIPFHIFKVSCNKIWKYLKQEVRKFEIVSVNPSINVIKTAWMDNTKMERLWNERFPYMTSEVQFTFSLGEGAYKNDTACRMVILKRQRVLTGGDFEWVNVLSDGVDEKVLFHRVMRRRKIHKSFEEIQ